ncbi:uncharacterized protein BDW47DRAFT_31352 [Aspergillus candidus]|uniref:Uncharacterized protein n=1 Tax=Aspergillus candidus TaxID=41067 RepID=A0A2I2FBS6_ASPCN|nr:hypothetical protein BDW47DRAFT_31352 [Aspergillus candidus]PLB38074.1 hypothetical protein BDW47DRAFT_31352 [Aspergillus candidus]
MREARRLGQREHAPTRSMTIFFEIISLCAINGGFKFPCAIHAFSAFLRKTFFAGVLFVSFREWFLCSARRSLFYCSRFTRGIVDISAMTSKTVKVSKSSYSERIPGIEGSRMVVNCPRKAGNSPATNHT